MRLAALAALLLALLSPAARAQDDQTLADIRQELNVLFVEVQRLKRELSTTGGPAVNVGGQSVLDRVAAIEAEMQRLTAQTEQLQFRINRIVEDGTNRIGDLEFRLVELEGGDVSQLGETTTLGGDVGDTAGDQVAGLSSVLPPASPPGINGVELAVGEEQDFTAAQEALAAGDYQAAAAQFAAFQQNYPGSPLAAGAELGRGEALEATGDQQAAARAYLSGFSIAPTGPLAAQILFRLGRSLGALNQTGEACLTLGEVEVRFPADPAVTDARAEMQRLGCS
jgi:tol-pal system protein YbgF